MERRDATAAAAKAAVASVTSRRDADEIARQVITSGGQVVMAGGEALLLPDGTVGRHGKGARKDTVDLIEEARPAGCMIIYT